jgi:hypothetical protein
LFLDWLQPSERVVVATWSHYDVWQLDLDLEAHGLPKLALPFLDVKKLAAPIVGSKSFEETVPSEGLRFLLSGRRKYETARGRI